MLKTTFRLTASWANSEEDHRDRGLPDSVGRVQASAVIWARWAEGKKARATRSRGLLNAGHFFPAPAPHPHGSVGATHLTGDRPIVPVGMFIGQHDDLGSNHLGVASTLPQTGDVLKLPVLLLRKGDGMRRFRTSGHSRPSLLRGVTQDTMRSFMSQNSERIHRRVYSLPYALIVIVPNLLPILGLFALMAVWRIPLNIATAMSASVAVGLIFDNTIQLLYRYRDARRAGADARGGEGRLARRAQLMIASSLTLRAGLPRRCADRW